MKRENVLSAVERLVRRLKRRVLRFRGFPLPPQGVVGGYAEASRVERSTLLESPQGFLVARDEAECGTPGASEACGREEQRRATVSGVALQIDLLRDEIDRLQRDLSAACHAWSRYLFLVEGRRTAGSPIPPAPPVCEQVLRNRKRFLDWAAREWRGEFAAGGLSSQELGTAAPAASWESQLQSLVGEDALQAAEPPAGSPSGNGSNGAERSSAALAGAAAQQSGADPAPPRSSAADEAEARQWLERGVELTERGQHAAALRAYDRALCIRPNYIEAWLNKGVALSAQRRYEKALRAYDEALRLSPGHPQIQHYRGILLAKQERYSEALAALDEALRLEPSLVGAWSDKGYVLIRLGFYSDAIAACNEALRLDPEHRGARVNRSRALNLQTRLRQRYPAASESRRVAAVRRKNEGRRPRDGRHPFKAKGPT